MEMDSLLQPDASLTQEPIAPPVVDESQAVEKEDETDIDNALLDLLKSARDEDRFVRDVQLRLWKRLEYYFNNVVDIMVDPVSRDWRVPDWDQLESSGEVPPRLINIYRPLAEAVIAALSVTIPGVIYHPDDAENPDDIETAKAMRAINGLISSHGSDEMLFIRALMILFNQGTAFAYNYYHEDPKFGTIQKPKVELKDVSTYQAECPECGMGLDAGVVGNHEEQYQCEECGYAGPAEISEGVERLPQIVGWDKTPKGTICREIYSGLNVKVPAYSKDQTNCGYILLEFAQSVAMLRSVFADSDKGAKIEARYDNTYESFAKLPIQYLGQQPENAANVSCLWLRPWQFYQLGNGKLEIIKKLKSKYPNGLYALFVNDELMVKYDENMDEHWTISDNPMGNFVYARPLGENLATIQDIRAQLVEIELQTAEYGIPETFFDERVLDGDKYGEGKAQPGMMTPVRPRSGKSISDAFHTTKSAILSQEIAPLCERIDQDAQLSVSAFPSVYGGVSTGGSKTASEYSQSKNMALQRLNITWKIICRFWCNLESKSAIEYCNVVKELGTDQRFTKKEGADGFVNVWIRQASLNGKVGKIEPEASEQLPVSWAQKRDVIMQLMTSGVEPVMAVLTHPLNAGLIKRIVGLDELFIPGEDNRTRQLKEFQLLQQGIPVPTNPMVDEDEVHIETLKHLLEGPLGESLSEEAMNVSMMHLQEHMMGAAQKAASEGNPSESGSTAPENEHEESV